jgi:hypothetical protein
LCYNEQLVIQTVLLLLFAVGRWNQVTAEKVIFGFD